MKEFIVLLATDQSTVGVFSTFKEAIVAYRKDKRSCNLLCMHPCGCVFRAIIKGRHAPKYYDKKRARRREKRIVTGWRSSERCPAHGGGSKEPSMQAYSGTILGT